MNYPQLLLLLTRDPTILVWNLLIELSVNNEVVVLEMDLPSFCFKGDSDMNEILRILWFIANGLLLLTAAGITINRIMSNIKEAEESSELSEASSFMNNTPV